MADVTNPANLALQAFLLISADGHGEEAKQRYLGFQLALLLAVHEPAFMAEMAPFLCGKPTEVDRAVAAETRSDIERMSRLAAAR